MAKVSNPTPELLGGRIALLREFYSRLASWLNDDLSDEERQEVRSFLNRNIVAARTAVLEAGTLKLMTIGPPPALDGMVMQNQDPFFCLFEDYYGSSLGFDTLDMVEQAIGVYEHLENQTGLVPNLVAEAIDIEGAIVRSLRPSFRVGPPESEQQVQDAIENILNALGVEFIRDREVAPVGPKAFKPDFTVPESGLAIEVKLAKVGHGAARIQEELAADVAGYSTKWSRLMAVIYDLGVIADPYKMRQDNMKKFGVTVLIVKH